MIESNHKKFGDLGIIEPLSLVCKKFGWIQPTDIQVCAIPDSFNGIKVYYYIFDIGKDIIAIAETGSGKTGAFLLPIIQQWFLAGRPLGYALILAPTRELVLQLASEATRLGNFDTTDEHIQIEVVVLVGGEDEVGQALKLAWRKHHIIVATPGRLINHLKQSTEFVNQQLSTIKHLVLDEADRMLNMAFADDIDTLLNLFEKPPLSRGKKKKRKKLLQKLESDREASGIISQPTVKTAKKLIPHPQTHLYSATMTKDVKKLRRAALRPDAVLIGSSTMSTGQQLSRLLTTNQGASLKTGFPSGLSHYCVPLRLADKPVILDWIVEEVVRNGLSNLVSPKQSSIHSAPLSKHRIIVFCKRCLETHFVAQFLVDRGYLAVGLTGRTKQLERKKALDEFIEGKVDILVATDVASRGLDIPHVQLVVNYSVPLSEKTYRHRVGRTARAGLQGVAVTMISRDMGQTFVELETSLAPYLSGSQIEQWPIPLPHLSTKSGLIARRRLADETWTRACKTVHSTHNIQSNYSDDNLSDISSLDENDLLDESSSQDLSEETEDEHANTCIAPNVPSTFKLNTSGSSGIKAAEASLKSLSKSKLIRHKERDRLKEAKRSSETIGWGLKDYGEKDESDNDDDDDDGKDDIHIDLPIKRKYDKIKKSHKGHNKRIKSLV